MLTSHEYRSKLSTAITVKLLHKVSDCLPIGECRNSILLIKMTLSVEQTQSKRAKEKTYVINANCLYKT